MFSLAANRWGVTVSIVMTMASASASAGDTTDIIERVKTGELDALRSLIEMGADVDATQGDGATAMHWAAHRNDHVAADLLITAGAHVGIANELGATPLWLAALNGSTPMVRRLLDAGANPNAALKMGEQPLMTAARSGAAGVVELLLEHGADIQARERERGQTALMWAVAQRQTEVVRILIAAGADLRARSNVWYQLENTAGNTNPIGNFRMAHGGSTALLFAARNGDTDTARVLVEAGANVNDMAPSGTSALVIAAHSGHTALATYLLGQGADPAAADAGYTALHSAILRDKPKMVDVLLAYGADPNTVVIHGTPGRRFSADYSLRHQTIGANALWLAAQYGEPEILKTLAEHGASPLLIPTNGRSALQAAMGMPPIYLETRRNRSGIAFTDPVEDERLTLEVARTILALGVDVNAADDRGNTALHDAVRKGFESVVELLAAEGADLNTPNGQDVTPLGLALAVQTLPSSNGARASRPKVAERLRELGASE
ncbi:MAG: ankyrin repeat domain-containing protein [Acidobacteriota bacterium]|nr:ankyrin repeat domain-containing protein [Acidobacteriota bacterium]